MCAWLIWVTLLLAAAPSARPPWVTNVFPVEGTRLTQGGAIRVDLDLTKVNGADPASLQLFIDDVNVTARATIAMTRDWPPSSVSLSYNPPDLQPGDHRAEIRLQVEANRRLSYAWTFTLKSL